MAKQENKETKEQTENKKAEVVEKSTAKQNKVGKVTLFNKNLEKHSVKDWAIPFNKYDVLDSVNPVRLELKEGKVEIENNMTNAIRLLKKEGFKEI